jgi:hypothetical protein
MLISSWAGDFRRKLALRGKRKPRRRAETIGMSPLGAQVQILEARAMLSAPTVTLSPAGPLNYVENSGAVVVAGNSTVTDTGVTNFNGATLTESLTANANAADQVGIRNQGNGAGQIGVAGSNVQYGGVTIGTETGGTGTSPLVVTFNGNATITAITAVQDNITFETTADSLASVSAPRTFQSVFSEGPSGNVSLPATETINILEANPVVNLNQGNLTISNSSATLLAPNATITSTETHNLSGGTLTISLTNGTSRDSLSILSHGASRAIRTSGNTVFDKGMAIGTFTGGEGSTPLVITFNSNATFADSQQLSQSITFRSIGHFAHQTDVNVTLTDGDGGVSNVASLSLDVIHGHSGNTGPGAPGHHGKG